MPPECLSLSGRRESAAREAVYELLLIEEFKGGRCKKVPALGRAAVSMQKSSFHLGCPILAKLAAAGSYPEVLVKAIKREELT
jgi:hypothetical protein